ncbi:MAG: SIS domain-containing protein, partial [Candidatus Wukongarchaeota archaeon]|nr:SIS domain-containing protein [Candidatus Wukongarchaeota archaeon]
NDVFPEINHNTIVGFEAKDALTKIFTTILLRDYDEPLEIKTRIETTKRVAIEEKTGRLIEVFGEGKSLLARMFSATFVGDFASIYLAILYEKDPATIITIDKLKKELKEKVGTQEKIKEAVNKLKR